jgi:hypothetical protein
MTDDFVKRLRDPVKDDDIEMLAWEAANEIERLRMVLDAGGGRYWEGRCLQLEAALRLGVDMREKQKAYFKRRFQDVLLDCKKAERDFDVSARAALGEKKDE